MKNIIKKTYKVYPLYIKINPGTVYRSGIYYFMKIYQLLNSIYPFKYVAITNHNI